MALLSMAASSTTVERELKRFHIPRRLGRQAAANAYGIRWHHHGARQPDG